MTPIWPSALSLSVFRLCSVQTITQIRCGVPKKTNPLFLLSTYNIIMASCTSFNKIVLPVECYNPYVTRFNLLLLVIQFLVYNIRLDLSHEVGSMLLIIIDWSSHSPRRTGWYQFNLWSSLTPTFRYLINWRICFLHIGIENCSLNQADNSLFRKSNTKNKRNDRYLVNTYALILHWQNISASNVTCRWSFSELVYIAC